MARKFVPLTLELIDEGEFLDNLASDLKSAQVALIKHIDEHGDAAAKAESTVTVKIKLRCEDPIEGQCSVKTKSTMTLPGRPTSVSLAMTETDSSGEPALFVRPSGSSESPPQQGKLTTKRGAVIDQNTGEIKE